MTTKQRVLIVDDHAILRRGVRVMIDNEPDLIVCAEAATHQAALDAIDVSRPDLVIADLSLGDEDGLVLVRTIQRDHADLPVLVLSVHDTPLAVERSFRAGANGYVTKGELVESLLIGIRSVLGSERFVSPRMKTRLDTDY